MSDAEITYTSIVCATDAGEQMGGPKALLAIRWGEGPGELPLAIAHARAHLDDGTPRVVIVVPSKVARVLSGFSQRGLDLIVSSEQGETSIKRALELLEAGPDDWLMIEPVGMPASSSAIRRELLRGAQSNPAVVQPIYEGRIGRPVLIRRRFLEPLVQGDEPTLEAVIEGLTLRQQQDPAAPAVLSVPVTDRRATTRFATPAELEAFYGRPTKFFLEDEPTFG